MSKLNAQAPDVSILIPTYNRLWSLPEAIQSCRENQCRIEIIVVDDGSVDGTWEWLIDQPDIRAIRQENAGKDWAVNRAFHEARGEYVRFLDSDDMLLPGSNDRLLEIARKQSADLVAAGFELLSQTGARTRKDWVFCDDFIAQQLGECDSSHYSAYLFRRSFLVDVPHRQEFGSVDDRMFIVEVALKGPKVGVVDQPTLLHRAHDRERLQSQKGLALAVAHHSRWQIYRRAARVLEGRGELTIRRRKAMSKTLWPLARWVAKHSQEEAKQLVGWIYNLDPEFIPPEGGLLGTLYRRLGFEWTEKILSFRRLVLALPTASRGN